MWTVRDYRVAKLENPITIQHKQKPLGVVCLYFKQLPSKSSYFESEEKLFQIFATQASFILQETWLLRRHQEVARIGQEINQEPSDVSTLFERLQKHELLARARSGFASPLPMM